MKLWTCASLVLVVGFLAACQRPFILEGERFPLRAAFSESAADAPTNRAQPISLPAPVANAEWTHRLGSANTRLTHPAFNGAMQQLWSVPIGQGETRRVRITAEPVAANGLIYTLDALARVTAVTPDGAVAWSVDLTPAGTRNPELVSGGGLTVAGGRLYVSSAHGFVHALDLRTGATIWAKRFDAPVTAPVTVAGERVFVVDAHSGAWALEAATGKTDWAVAGTPSPAAMVGGAAPALVGDLVVFPTSAGELIAVNRTTGQTNWKAIVAGTRIGVAYASVTDVTGDPVVQGDTIYVGNQSGRVMALSRLDGRPIWTAMEAAYGPVWPVGGSVFLLSDRNRLIRLNASDGSLIWSQPLPLYTEIRERRRAQIFPHYGPVLAGGRLIVGSGDGVLRSFDPVSGAMTGEVPLRSGAAVAPIVVGGRLYVVTRDGQLVAFR
ncbi:MAG: PQQ-binding-like beta-propeller repeat protein [Roseinatronobacter sp.]